MVFVGFGDLARMALPCCLNTVDGSEVGHCCKSPGKTDFGWRLNRSFVVEVVCCLVDKINC